MPFNEGTLKRDIGAIIHCHELGAKILYAHSAKSPIHRHSSALKQGEVFLFVKTIGSQLE